MDISPLQDSPALLAMAAGVLGLAVGSFLNVVIHRLPIMMRAEWRADCAELEGREPPAGEKLNLLAPRSRCPACSAPITPLQNIPLASWIALGGRCAACRAPISIRYPLVELAAGTLALFCALRFGAGLQLAAALAISWTLLALALIDLEHQLLPDDLTLPLLWLGLLASLWHPFVGPRDAILGAAVGYLSLWIVFHLFKALTGKEGFGYGDFKLLAAFGAWFGVGAILPIVLLASVAGALVGLGLMAARRATLGSRIAFGVYLCPAGWLYMMWGAGWVRSYMAAMGPG